MSTLTPKLMSPDELGFIVGMAKMLIAEYSPDVETLDRWRGYLDAGLAHCAALEAQVAKANTPFENAIPEVEVYRHEKGWFCYRVGGIDAGPYQTWREAYRAGEGYFDYANQVTLNREQAATIERLKREITLLRQEVDEAKYKDTVEVDGLAAIGRLAVLIHEQTEDVIARDAAVEIQNIVRGGERG